MQMHVLECHATMAHASMKSHRIDVNVNEAMKVRHAIEHLIRAQVSFATTEVSVTFNKISNQCVNVSLVIEERIATIKMVCADDSVRCLLVRMSCMLFFLAFFSLVRMIAPDACDNLNCNHGRCLLDELDGIPYCECLPDYQGVLCLDESRVIDSRE